MKIWILIFQTFLTLTTFGKVIPYTFNEQCKKATEIFTGRIIKMTVINEGVPDKLWTYRTFEIKFVTNKVWKGFVNDTMTCIASEGICSPNYFELDKEYLVYSEKGKISLGSGRSGNVQYNFVRADMRKLTIRYLFRRPKKNPDKDSKNLTLIDKPPAYNTGFASGGVTCKFSALCFYSSSALVDSFVLRNPPERKARKR